MHPPRFEILRMAQTEEAAISFLRELDAQIEELQEQLSLLQLLRRSTAATFGMNRAADASNLKRILDSADRSHYEGDGGTSEDGRLVPRKVAS